MTPPIYLLWFPSIMKKKNITALMGRMMPVLHGMEHSFEVILVDDGSTDGCLKIMKDLTIQPEISVVELTRNYGQHAAIFAGFSQAQGEIIITLMPIFRTLRKRSRAWCRSWKRVATTWWVRFVKDGRTLC